MNKLKVRLLMKKAHQNSETRKDTVFPSFLCWLTSQSDEGFAGELFSDKLSAARESA